MNTKTKARRPQSWWAKLFFFACTVPFAISAQAYQDGTLTDPSSRDSADLFEKVVAPAFQASCISCHNEIDREGGLSIATPFDLRDGGFLDQDAPEQSVLIDMIRSDAAGHALMPENGDPLKQEVVESITEWIRLGAVWPADRVLTQAIIRDRQWWSLQPLERPSLPKLDTTALDQASRGDATQVNEENPIDRFIAARLKDHGLEFSPEADRRTLIRRLYYDLTGLPPTMKEIESFENDSDPMAYEKLVDRLLASQRYGERWARHWLDVAHYGDSHGYDKDKLRPNAWPYRDYVIRAFNEDKPYSRFVREQLAGDVLYPETVDGMVGPGFLAAGPWDFIGHAEVPETKIDGQVARNLDRDDMVSTTLNAFCSLTVQCARCHNHKLDPVSMQDYYRLQAVFAAVDRADRDYDVDPAVARERWALLQQREANERQQADLLAQMETKLEATLSQEDLAQLRALELKIDELKSASANVTQNAKSHGTRSNAFGYHSQVAASPSEVKWVQIDLGGTRDIDQIVIWPAVEYGWSFFGFPRSYRVENSDDPNFQSAQVLFETATQGSSALNEVSAFGEPSLGQPVLLDFKTRRARYVRLTATELWNRRKRDSKGEQPLSQDWIFAVAEMEALNAGQRLPVAEVVAKDSIEALPRWGKQNLVDTVLSQRAWESSAGFQGDSPTNGYHSEFAYEADSSKWVQVELPSEISIGEIRLIPAFPTDWEPTPGFGFPTRFVVQASSDPEFTDPITLIDHRERDVLNPGGRDYVISGRDCSAKYIRLTANRLWHRDANNYALALAEILVVSSDRERIPVVSVTASDSIEAGRWSTRYLNDGFTSRSQLSNYGHRLKEWLAENAPRESLAELESAVETRRKSVLSAEYQQLQLLVEQRDQIAAQLSSLPSTQSVYVATVHAGSGAFRGRAGLGPREIHVLHRGEVTKPLETVHPGAVPLLEGDALVFDLPDPMNEGARRAALAEWIVDPQNPLTWRSVANRIWHYHFGKGLVDTPNDFGRGGSSPTHPELLDWLAVEFRDGGQSWKAMHRLICTSRTYRQASSPNADDSNRELIKRAQTTDQDNRLLWRMNRRRLSAEEIRDTVLFATGKLDLTMGGPGFHDFVIEHPEHSPHYEYEKHNPLDPATHRRAVYRFIVRSQPQPLMNSLDCADPSVSVAARVQTLTPLQALSLLNNPFMTAMSQVLAERLEREYQTTEDQIQAGYRNVLGRSPSEEELETLTGYANEHGMKNLCRVLFNLNEFVFID